MQDWFYALAMGAASCAVIWLLAGYDAAMVISPILALLAYPVVRLFRKGGW